ncbi:alpha/beta fold hydrolase [Archangium lansingense]|uniref:alpha/beta fold hydrolase n=1 Tax=Archangium lansingense TaxID=2995310 RepID=UPI003B76965B
MYQTTGTIALPVALPLEEGGLLGRAQLAWHAYGERSDDNVAVLLHDLTHSHQALGPAEEAAFQPSGWGTELIGEGRPLDTSTLHVVVPNLLGSPFGSTSPVTVDERAGLPYGAALPTVTVTDMARAVAAMLRGMKVERVRALVGVGLGGMVALRLAALFPELVTAVVVLGAARALPEPLRERLGLTRHVLRLDPDFRDGQYERGHGPKRTLRKQYLEYLRLVHGTAAEQALEAEADAFAESFDANTWALLCTAYAGGDVTDGLSQIRAPVLLVAASEDSLAPPSRVRDTYHLISAAGVRAHYHELPTPSNHASLLTQARRLHGPMRDFLRRRG